MNPLLISDALRAEVLRRKEIILGKRALVTEAEKELEKVTQQHFELSAELERGCDPLNTEQVIRRQALLTQVPVLESIISRLQSMLPTLKNDVSWVSTGTREIIEEALESFRAETLKSITDAMLPFHKTVESAEKSAKQTEAWLDLHWFCFKNSWSTPDQALATLDELLAGKNPWKFQSAHSEEK